MVTLGKSGHWLGKAVMARCGWQSKSAAVATQSRTASPVGAGPGSVGASRHWRGNAVKGGKVGKLRQGNAVESRLGRARTGKARHWLGSPGWSRLGWFGLATQSWLGW
jgi:hypothetical protein